MILVIIVASALKNCVFTQSLSCFFISYCSISFLFNYSIQGQFLHVQPPLSIQFFFFFSLLQVSALASWSVRANPFTSFLAQTGLSVQRFPSAVIAVRCHCNTTFNFPPHKRQWRSTIALASRSQCYSTAVSAQRNLRQSALSNASENHLPNMANCRHSLSRTNSNDSKEIERLMAILSSEPEDLLKSLLDKNNNKMSVN